MAYTYVRKETITRQKTMR